MLNTHVLEQVKTAFGNEFIYYLIELFLCLFETGP